MMTYVLWHNFEVQQALQQLNMTKLHQHPLWKIRLHICLALNEVKEKGLLGERPNTLVALKKTPNDNIHLEAIHLLPHRISLLSNLCWLPSASYQFIQSIDPRLKIANNG